MHQAMKPHGAMGVVMGWFLETGNAAQNRVTVEALDPPPGGKVLEIGFGPGQALEMLARARPLALVAGIDHSELMVASARRRLDGGRGDAGLDLRCGDAGELPFADESFDLVFAVNSFHQWPRQGTRAGRDDRRAEARRRPRALDPRLPHRRALRTRRRRRRRAQEAAGLLRDLGLQVRTREIVHSPKRATFLVRGESAGGRTSSGDQATPSVLRK